MPALDLEGLKHLRAWIVFCAQCQNWELRNYCRECDEFFIYGHDEKCPRNPHQHEEHQRHRTY